jgi:hypothetical protein
MNKTFSRRTLVNTVAAVVIAASAVSAVATTRVPSGDSTQPRVTVDDSKAQKQVNPGNLRKARLMVYEANCRGNEIGYAKSQTTESNLGKGATVWACQLSL